MHGKGTMKTGAQQHTGRDDSIMNTLLLYKNRYIESNISIIFRNGLFAH